jgi:acetyl-CoA acyltransferase
VDVPGTTVNRLCGSSMDAIGIAARAIKSGETSLMIAGGVESMSRAPFVMGKADSAYSRVAKIEDTTIGWRFVNPLMKSLHGVDSMPETAENVAVDFKVSRADQDAFALRSQQRAAAAIAAGRLAEEIVAVSIPQKKDDPVKVERDEHPRETTLGSLGKLKGVVRPDGSVTAGNASGVNDGACAVLLASADAARKYGLKPRARVVATAVAGVAPRIMGFGPAPAMRKVLAKAGLTLADIDVIELNEAFAAQALAVLRDHGIADDAAYVNPNGGAIALGHPLGASGARLVTTALYQLERSGGRRALCTMCIGVGQGIAMIIERV